MQHHPLAAFYSNPRLTVLAVGFVAVLGFAAYAGLARQEDPTLTERFASIHTPFPGANAERVEALVTEKLETRLREIEEVKELRSRSRAGFSNIRVELYDNVAADRVDVVWSEVRDKLESARPDLPAGAGVPELVKRAPIAATLLTTFTWRGAGEAQLSLLSRLAEELAVRLANLPGTKETQVYGAIEEEVVVAADQAALAARGITLEALAARIAAADTRAPAGTLTGRDAGLLLEVKGELDSAEQVARIPLLHDAHGMDLRVADVAAVSKAARTPPPTLAYVDGERAVFVEAKMEPDRRIDLWSAAAHAAVERFRADLPSDIGLEVVFDQNAYTSARLGNLVVNLALSFALVIATLVFFMGARAAIAVGLALPLTIAIVLSVLYAMGVPLHQMSVTGLVIALGLLIDNAIVVVDDYQQRRNRGTAPLAAIDATVRSLFVPLAASTATTVLAFLPIATAPGTTGEFTGTIGISVILSVVASLAVACTLTPAFAAFSERWAGQRRWWDYGWTSPRLTAWYGRFLDAVIARPRYGLALGLLLPLVGFALAPTLTQQFFPPTDRDQFQVQLLLPSQATVAETARAAQRARALLAEYDGIEHSYWFVGEPPARVYYNVAINADAMTSFAGAFVKTRSAETTAALLPELQTRLRREFPNARVLVLPFEQGPPFDAPIEVRVIGSDLNVLRDIGDGVRRVLTETPGVTYTTAALGGSAPQLSVYANENVAARVGLDLGALPSRLAAQLSGIEAGAVMEGSHRLPIRVRADAAGSSDIEALQSLTLVRAPQRSSAAGTTLDALARIRLEPAMTDIDRYQGERCNTVQAFLMPFALPAAATAAFEERLAESGLQLPAGYRFSAGGEAEQRSESVGRLLGRFATFMTLMVVVVVVSLNSFRRAGIVFCVALLSVGLALFGVRLFGYPFGFMALIGVLGMIGLAVNGAIIVLSLLQGDARAAAGDATAIRVTVVHATRHILSTTATTIGGFVPLILFGGTFWPPLATAVAGGVAGSAILALVTVPALFVWTLPRNAAGGADVAATVVQSKLRAA